MINNDNNNNNNYNSVFLSMRGEEIWRICWIVYFPLYADVPRHVFCIHRYRTSPLLTIITIIITITILCHPSPYILNQPTKRRHSSSLLSIDVLVCFPFFSSYLHSIIIIINNIIYYIQAYLPSSFSMYALMVRIASPFIRLISSHSILS